MSTSKKCQFYRSPQGLTVNRGYCDLVSNQTICGGTVEFCENPDALKKRSVEQNGANRKEEKDYKKKPSHYKVLVVDDEKSMTEIMSLLLSKIGHQDITASNGVEALNKINQNRVDAVITDIVMPEMDGITLTKELLIRYPNLPIMVMTGHGKEFSAQSAIAAGARDFIEKPFSLDEFILRFNKMMRDYEILRQIEAKQNEILLHLSKKSLEKIDELKREIENLKNRLCSVSDSL